MKFGKLILPGIVSMLFLQHTMFGQGTCGDILTARNLIVNGDFENIGIVNASYSGYDFKPYSSGGAISPGDWAVIPSVVYDNYVVPTNNGIAGDHTKGNSSGHHMLIDVDSRLVAAYKTTVTVQPNTTYFFSCWIANTNGKNVNPSNLQFYVGTDLISPQIIKPDGAEVTDASLATHEWTQFYTSWSSGTRTGLIEISMKNIKPEDTGNDLALDDITFSTSCKWVNQLEKSHFPDRISVCNGQSVLLDAGITESGTFSWFIGNTFASATKVADTKTYTVPGNTFGKHYFCYTINQCSRLDSAIIVNEPIIANPIIQSPAKCGGDGTITFPNLVPAKSYTVTYTFGGSPVTRTITASSLGQVVITGKKGTYTDLQLGANGCLSNKQNVTLNDPTGIVLNLNGVAYDPKSNCTSTWNVKLYGVTRDLTYAVKINRNGIVTTQNLEANSSTTAYVQVEDLLPGSYIFSVTDPNTACESSLSLNLTVTGGPVIVLTPANPSCAGNDGSISVKASGLSSGEDYILSYTLNGVTKTIPFTAANSSPPAIPITGLGSGSYSVFVELSDHTCSSQAKTADLTAPSPIVANISTAPVCTGNTAKIDLTTPTGGPGSPYTYTWEESADSSSWNASASAQSNGGRTITTAVLNTAGVRYYRVIVTSGTCKKPFSVKLTINSTPLITGPVTGSLCSGAQYQSGAISVNSSNGVTFDWTRAAGLGNSATSGNAVTLSTGITETLINSTANSGNVTYKLIPKTAFCTGASVDLVVAVNLKPSVTAPLTGSVCSGQAYSSGALTTVPATGVTYSWTRAAVSGNPAASGNNLASTTGISEVLTNSGTADLQVKYVIAPRIGSCPGDNFEVSVLIRPATIITKQPKDTTLCEGSSLNLVVSAAGTGPFSYQWKQAGANVGTDSRTYTKANAAGGDAGSYTVTVTGGCGAPVSNAAVVTINTKPAITVQPADASGCENSNSSLNVTATGTGPLTYQWKKVSGGNVGTNSNSLSFTPLKASDAGDYTVTVSNSCAAAGVVSTQVKVSITLTEKPGVVLSIDSTALCSGNSIVLTAGGTGGGAAPKYTFSDAGGTIGTADQLSNTVTIPLTNAGPADKVETYTVKMLSNSACLESGAVNPAVSTSKTVTVYARPAAAVAGSPEIICGSSYQLKGVAPAIGTGKWTANPASVSFDDATKANANATNLPAGSAGTPVAITFTWTVKNGTCPAVQSSVVITRSGDLTDPAPVVDKITVCEGGSVILGGATPSAANNETSKWTVSPATGVSLTSTANTAAASATFTAAGTYVFTYEIDNPTCNPSAKTVTVNVIAPPVAHILGPKDVTSPGRDNQTFNQLTQTVTSEAAATGYSGAWKVTKISGTGTPSPATGTGTSIIVADMDFNDSASVTWTVTDAGSKCTPAVATVILIRKDVNIADVKDDSLCVSNIGTYTLKGNGLLPTETGKWEVDPPAGGVSVTSTDGKNATISGLTIPANAGKTELTFKYTITSTVPGVNPTSDVMKLTVYEAPETATTGGDITTCADKVTLTGNNPLKQPTATGQWTKLPADQGVFVDATKGNSQFTGLDNEATSTLTWTISNHLCGTSTATMKVIQAGKMTTPEVSISGGTYTNENITGKTADLCVGTAYTLTATTPNAVKGESGAWGTTTAGTTGITATGSTVIVPVTATAAGTGTDATVLSWTITPTVAGCTAETATITLNAHGVPTGGTIDGNSAVCEGTDTLYKVNPAATSTLPITYTWDAGTPGAQRAGAATGTSTRYKFTSDAAGTISQGTVRVTAGNACGSAAPLSKTVDIRLAPRKFTAAAGNADARILGLKEFCATETLVGYKLDEIQQNVDGNGYRWYWDNKPVTAKPDTAAIGISQVSNWDPTLGGTHRIKVELTNHCSDTARIRAGIPVIFKDTVIEVKAPVPVTVSLSSDKAGNKFCIPDDQVIFTPTITTNLSALVTAYTFKVDGAIKQGPGPLSTYTANRNELSDGAQVTVELSPAANQCIQISPGSPIVSIPVEMEGFAYPDSNAVILSGIDTICENKASITLTIQRSRTGRGSYNDNGGVTWYKDNVLMVPQPNTAANPQTFDLTLTTIWESGKYMAQVKGSTCAHTGISKDTVPAKIYEQPEATVLINPYAVPYVEGINLYQMPVVVTKPVKDTLTSSYYLSEVWLQNPKDPRTILVPEKREETIPYVLTLETGKPDANGTYGGCRLQKAVVIVYYLPVIIPNAFTPNGDGLNDTWVITGLGKYPQTKVKVYNRWGTAMFVDNDGYRAVWDGTHNGQPLPTGTYYYIVELKGSPDGTDENRTGHLTIIR